MRNIFLLAALFWSVASYAQSPKVITKTIDAKGINAELKFDFAEDIRIEAWNKNTIELEVSVDLEDNKYNDYYNLEVNEESNGVSIVEKVDFEGIKQKRGENKMCNFETTINYKLRVPSSLVFSLKTISGNVELLGALGKMKIKSVSGFIDYSIPASHKAQINLATVTGEVYSNVKFDNKPSSKISWVGTKRDLSLNSGTLPVELKTVSGDIFLRKL